jgi:hypothetical protein
MRQDIKIMTETKRYTFSYTHEGVKYWCISTKHWFFSPSFNAVVLMNKRKTAEKALRDKVKHEGEVELQFGDGNPLDVPFIVENLKLEEIRLSPVIGENE